MKRGIAGRIAAWLLIVAAMLVPGIAAAGPVAVPLKLCVARDTGQAAAAMFAASARFDCTTPQHDFGQGSFWVRVQHVPADTGLGLSRVRMGSQWMAALTLYARYADGRIVAQRIAGTTLAHHVRLGAIIEQELPGRGTAITGLLWHVQGSGNFRRILGDVHVGAPLAMAREDLANAIFYAGFVGLGLALVVVNLALWVALRYRVQLAYCAMVTGLLAYATTSSGAIAYLWPALSNNVRISISYTLLPVSTAAALWFAGAFLGRTPRWLGTALRGLVGALLTGPVLFALLAPAAIEIVDHAIGLAYAGVVLITVPLVWTASRRGAAFAAVFILAWSTPVLLAAMRVTNTFRLLPISFSVQTSLVALMGTGVLLSSVAIAYRIHLLARDRDDAREQEIAARLLADTDPLTGLLNRRAFLRQAIGRQEDQLLVLVDIDHFKHVNETIGHDGGDEVLRVFARALRTDMTPDALVARIGGEEFAVVMPAASAVQPGVILDRLRSARMPFDMTVTASLGSCTGVLARETDWKLLYRNADRALFAAKAAGRDRARDAATLAIAA